MKTIPELDACISLLFLFENKYDINNPLNYSAKEVYDLMIRSLSIFKEKKMPDMCIKIIKYLNQTEMKKYGDPYLDFIFNQLGDE